MGKGGPLAFLTKKPWHPSRPQNLEEVWKREQNAAAEQKKLEELRLQYEEERKNEEFNAMARQAGHGAAADRLDWMYAGSMAAKEDAAKRQEAALLGQKPAQLAPEAQQDLSRCEVASSLAGTSAAALPVASQNEQWARLNNDPLLMIKRQQQEALKKVRDNPIKMQEVIKQVREQSLAAAAMAPKKDKKHGKEKKHKKEKKRHRKDRGSADDSSDSGSEGRAARHAPPPHQRHHDRERELHGREAGTHHQRDRQGLGGPVHSHSRDRLDRSDRLDRHEAHGDRGRPAPGPRSHAGRSRSRSPAQHGGRHQDGNRTRHTGRSRSRSPAPHGDRDSGRHAGRSRSPSPALYSGRHADRNRDRHVQQGRGDQPRELERGGERDRQDRPAARQREGEDGRGREEDQPNRAGPMPPQAKNEAKETARLGTDGRPYGLSQSHAAPAALQQYDASQRAQETRERLKEAARRKEEEERAKAAQRYQKQQHKTGKMTDEERARRLAEMSANAETHDAARIDRLSRAAQADAAQGGGGAIVSNANGVSGAAKQGDAFVAAASRDVFAAMAGSTIESRVGSRKHYTQR